MINMYMTQCACGRYSAIVSIDVIRCPFCERILIAGSEQQKEASNERRRSVKLAVEQKHRLIGWLQFFRLDTDRGVGDTANRINSRTGPRRELHLMLESLLKQCSCSRRDAVATLNRSYPY